LAELRLLGGEPLLQLEDTIELLATANRLGVKKAVVYTSAVEPSFAWLRRLASFSPMRVSAEASIYSPSAAIHDSITQSEGSLERLLVNVREAVRIGFTLDWNFVWMRPNFGELEPVVALASRVGIKTVRVLRLMLNGRAHENVNALALPLDLEAQLQSTLQDVGDSFPAVILKPSKPLAFQFPSEEGADRLTCTAGEGQLVVEADGTVIPCIGMKRMHFLDLGNVRTRSLRDMLAASKEMQFARLSQHTRECPAIAYRRKVTELVQLNLDRRSD